MITIIVTEEMKTTTIFLTRVENDQAANTMYELIFLNRRKPISKTFTMSQKRSTLIIMKMRSALYNLSKNVMQFQLPKISKCYDFR